ncbi:MAG: hypothetical protein J5527_09430 [Treponema sp.]|nr:hypothetical protein [Treponema sp.]
MSVTIKLPAGKNKEELSLYVKGKITYKITDPELGTLIHIEGTGIAFYSASNSRRAIIFQEITEKDYGIPLEEGKIPYVKQDVRILYKAKGRKIELLKFMCYRLEKKYGQKIYGMGITYWLSVASFIETSVKRKNQRDSNFRKIEIITDKYMEHGGINENK